MLGGIVEALLITVPMIWEEENACVELEKGIVVLEVVLLLLLLLENVALLVLLALSASPLPVHQASSLYPSHLTCYSMTTRSALV